MANAPPKIALIDLENSPIIGAAWEMWDTDILWIEQDWYLLSYSVKWLGGKHYTKTLTDFPLFKREKNNDRDLVKSLWKVFDEAEILVAHNGNAFDIKKAHARFITHNLPPHSPFVAVDTLSEARKIAKFSSNKLDSVCATLGIGHKLPNTGKDLWKRCMKGDRRAFEEMREYNAHDVVLLEKLYLHLRPWMKTHPNLRLFDGKVGCPICGSQSVQRRGVEHKLTYDVQRLSCNSCGKNYYGGKIKRT